MDKSFVEEVALSLVRGFLSRKHLRKTIAVMDQEFPRSSRTINNKKELSRVLHLHSLYKENKVRKQIVLPENVVSGKQKVPVEGFRTRKNNRPLTTEEWPDDKEELTAVNNLECKTEGHLRPLEKLNLIWDGNALQRLRKTITIMGQELPCSAKSINNKKELCSVLLHSLYKENKETGNKKSPTPTRYKEDQVKDVLELVHAEDEETTGEVSKNLDLATLSALPVASEAIDICLAKELKSVLFGSSLCCFSEEWKIQSFTFDNTPQLKYDIVQEKGGPCGVLAAVQACVLQQLIFADSNSNEDPCCLQPSEVHRTKCLTMAIADILWRAGGNEKAVVALVRNDFDVLTNQLIGSNDFCTQELVNLLLPGKAVSSVFDNVIYLDSGNGNITMLKGITSRSDIGLLSVFERYDVCQVGSYLKSPKYPIWLVGSESHFSVLFCLEEDLSDDCTTGRRFDLYYYDGLANQEEEIRLIVDTTQVRTEGKENYLTSPVEHCIRTKWQGAVIDWNGTEPIF